MHIVLIHGMGKGDWARPDSASASQAMPAIHRIATALGMTLPGTTGPSSHRTYGGVELYSFNLISSVNLVFHEINYARHLIAPGRESPPLPGLGKARLFDEDLPLLAHAARYNRQVKQNIVSWGLADAVTYLHVAAHRRIRANVAAALRAVARTSADTRVVFIAESLGSRVLLDALFDLHFRETGAELERPETRDDRKLLDNIQAVYFLANQLPLLELGVAGMASAAYTEGAENVIRDLAAEDKVVEESEETASPRNLYFVALSDPNDLLTYPIRPTITRLARTVGRDDQSTRLKAVDVLVRNAMPVLGLFANPLPAHGAHLRRPATINLLVNGRRWPPRR